MRRSAWEVLGVLALFAAVSCAAFRSAEKDPAKAVADAKHAADQACALVPAAKLAGALKGPAAADADKFCSSLAAAEAE